MALLGRVKANPVLWLSLQLALIREHPSKLWRFASAQAARSPAPLSRCNPRTCLVLELSSSLSSHRCPPPAPSHPRRLKPRVPVGSCWPVAELRGATACSKSPAPFPKLQSLSQSISQSLQSPRAPNFSWHAFLAWARTLPISTPGSQEAFFIFFLKFAENIHVFWEPSPFVPGSLGEINGP